MKTWKFSHNNCPEIVLDLPDNADERAAVRAGLDRIGLINTDHPVRAWQHVENTVPETPIPEDQ